MQNNQSQAKGYSFYFNRAYPSTSPVKIACLNQPSNPLPNRNVHINFRYNTEGQQIDKKPLLKKDSLKTHLATEKNCEPVKKYTFSQIANQVKHQRALEGKQFNGIHIHPTQNDHFRDSTAEKHKIGEIQENFSFKYSVKPNLNVQPQRSHTQELSKERQAKLLLERQFNNYKTENGELNMKIKQLQKLVLVKESQIKELNDKMQQLKIENIESRNRELVYLKKANAKPKELVISSGTLSFHLLDEGEQSFEKQTKEWSNSTIIQNYEQEYKQVLSIFQIELNEENYHDRLLVQIEKLFKRVEEISKSQSLVKEKQKENARLAYFIRKIEAENIHFANLIPPLNKELAKVNDSLQQANKEIELLNILKLNSRYAKFCE